MAARCRLCFVRLDRCYDEPSGDVMNMLQAFVATRRYKNAHIHMKPAQKSPIDMLKSLLLRHKNL